MSITLRRCTGMALVLFAIALMFAGLAGRLPGTRSFQPAANGEASQLSVHLTGPAAKEYLERTSSGQSLMTALEAARFGLQRQEHAPFDKQSAAGYLGISHDQNLTAWFSETGVTVRPAAAEAESLDVWQLGFRLKAYGYGKDLVDAPPITSDKVAGTRIEYAHSFNPNSKFEKQKLIEWYENRPEGIEQGFSVHEPPAMSNYVGTGEPLRLVVSIKGDLHARSTDNGSAIDLLDGNGAEALRYSKLVAQDAEGKRLPARMEVSADGREIALLVQEKDAHYPIVIDPVVASLEKKLEALTVPANARFGFSVAIDGDLAMVGAWREKSDVGRVYLFSRSGSTWNPFLNFEGDVTGDQCGWSVAISGTNAVYGCPGAGGGVGKAILYSTTRFTGYQLTPDTMNSGDHFGYSVAIRFTNIIVGALRHTDQFNQFAVYGGAVHSFKISSGGLPDRVASDVFGPPSTSVTSIAVALDGDTIVAGAPDCDAAGGCAPVYHLFSSGSFNKLFTLRGSAGSTDGFGDSVAISGNTAVVGAVFDDTKATDAGAAYVFVRDSNGNWSQQQKLTASDGEANDYFSSHAVAIEGNTIVVGAYAWEPFTVNGTTDYGKAYVFMRNGTVWNEQTTMLGDNNGGDNFGIGVGINGNSVIAGARAATASGVASAGAAYVYRLDCVPPSRTRASANPADFTVTVTYCPGSSFNLTSTYTLSTAGTPSLQWRKNAVNIPGATSNSYFISSVSAADAGVYDIVVSNSCGSDISNAVTLNIHSFSINPASQNFGVSGSNGVVNVSSTGNCSWTAVSNANFITITSGASGSGNGTVGFTVAPNPNPGQRTGTITVAGKTFNVSQDGTNCSYSILPASQSFDANASTKTISVTTGAGCNWTATSNDSFVSINSGASGSGNGTVTYTVAANFSTSQRSGTLTVAGQTFTVTQAGVPPPAQALNISTRMLVQGGNSVLIAGFIVTGTDQKTVAVRGIGPSLSQFFSGTLADPTLELHTGNTTLATNDNWQDDPTQAAQLSANNLAPADPKESGIVATLPPQTAYTAILAGKNGGAGIGVLDMYDLNKSANAELANISSRGFVLTDNNVMIGGFILGGNSGNTRIAVRGIGPSLAQFGLSPVLSDPTLELHDGNGVTIATNDNWQDDSAQATQLSANNLAPAHPNESAIFISLPPGQWTAVLAGKNGGTGIGVVEVFNLH